MKRNLAFYGLEMRKRSHNDKKKNERESVMLTLMTWPSVLRDWLMLAPSFSLSPVAPVCSARSEPARSMRCNTDSREWKPSASFLDNGEQTKCMIGDGQWMEQR